MNKIYIIILTIIVGVGLFYGGMKYGKSRAPGGGGFASSQNMRNFSSEQRQQMMQQFRNGGSVDGRRGGTGGQAGGGFISGEIINKDDKSLTVKLSDGSSKIVFFSGNTNIGKTTKGAVSDLEIGEQVMVNGIVNSDGSVSAQNIQLRSNLPAPD